MKQGLKASTEHMVVYLNRDTNQSQVRFGIVVGKTVGNAVQRNLVKRRARAVFMSKIDLLQAGSDLVLRALPGLAEISWSEFNQELESSLTRLASKAAK